MKITLVISIAFLGAALTMAQVGIVKDNVEPPVNFPHTSAALEVSSSDQGFLAPRVALISVTNPEPVSEPKSGLLVYNSTDNVQLDKGYYYWSGVQWYPWRKSSNTIVNFQADDISVTTLGYMPVGEGDTSPQSFNYGSIIGTKIGCFKFNTGENATGHSYCGYDLKDASNAPQNINWTTAFSISKALNGYLVTSTSEEEWNFIKNNLLVTSFSSQNQSNVWLGFNKVTYPGNPLQFTWITGERSMVAWERAGISNSPYLANASFEFNFATGEPNNAGGNEGCVQVQPASSGANRLWNDVACNTANVPFLIVEFQN